MLAELAAFNAGYAVLKTTFANGREISGALGSLANMVGAEEDLRARGNRKKSSIWSKAFGKDADLFEEFQALEDIKAKRKEMESLCRLFAPSGTWNAFLTYEAKVRVQRKEEAEEREKAIAKMVSYATWALASVLSIGGFYALYMFTDFLKNL